jgi:hypothetical protein
MRWDHLTVWSGLLSGCALFWMWVVSMLFGTADAPTTMAGSINVQSLAPVATFLGMANEQTEEENTLPTPPADEKARQDMRQRAEACGAELQQVLTKHRCFIQPFLQPVEPVGNDGSKAMVTASYAVLPHE